MTDKQSELGEIMQTLSGTVDDQTPMHVRALLNRACDLHKEIHPGAWAERVRQKPRGRER